MLKHVFLILFLFKKFSVIGNSDPEQGRLNAHRLLKANEKTIPIFCGQAGPIINKKHKKETDYHGFDGFGDVPNVPPTLPDIIRL